MNASQRSRVRAMVAQVRTALDEIDSIATAAETVDELPKRARVALERIGVSSPLELRSGDEMRLLRGRQCGRKTVKEIREWAAERGVTLS